MGCELFSDFFAQYDVPVIRIRRRALLKINDVDEENIYILDTFNKTGYRHH